MPVLLKCPSRLHTVRLDSNRYWQTAICPKCKVPVDPTRLHRLMKRLSLLFSNPTGEKIGVPPANSSKKAPVMRERIFKMLNLLKSKQLAGLKDFREEDTASFEIKTSYAEYGHRTWLTYELNNDGSAVRMELTHILGKLDFNDGVKTDDLLRLLSMNIPSFQNSSFYIGTQDMGGTFLVSLNSSLIFLTKWSDEDIADAFSVRLFDLVMGLAMAPPPPIQQFGAE